MIATLLLALGLQGQPQIATEAPGIVAALTQETVEIREDFDGAELVLYGATRGLTIQDEIVVVLRGPGRDLRVMQKARSFGIWVNSAPLEFDDVPSYYAIATSLPLETIAGPEELERSGIGLQAMLEANAAAMEPSWLLGASTAVDAAAPDAQPRNLPDGASLAEPPAMIRQDRVSEYLDAIARDGRRDNVFAEAQRGVEILDGGLFRATIALPPLTPVGDYVAEVYLFRDGRPIASRSASLRVEKAGIERFFFEFAHDLPILYGLFCVLLAMLAGYIANLAFNRR
ncbi:TIGR02186 family protein [uncultured Maricaulis sp.]|jgi:putative transmembrane protein Alph_Pro_TM|uniref:TIGR02186 family protein n=1 Tax=uncultured Maricaulis sp. TaxID=174710 RepID=UPI0025F70345|nr:TIGR02186 family protein [uncultured Maricaulis sp.]